MTGPGSSSSHPSILRVFQSKDEIKRFYNKISKLYDLLAEKSEAPIRRLGLDRLNARPGGRVVVVGMSKASPPGPMLHLFEWTHQHFPNYLDCRPIFVRECLEQAGFDIASAETEMMWIPVEIVCGVKPNTTPAA